MQVVGLRDASDEGEACSRDVDALSEDWKEGEQVIQVHVMSNGAMQVTCEPEAILQGNNCASLLGAFMGKQCQYVARSSVEVLAFCKALNHHGNIDYYARTGQKPQQMVESHRTPRVLIIAGSDSGGGAGIQADMKACTNAGVFSASAVTAITAQNTFGVHSIHAVPVHEIEAQITCVLDDIGADAVKTGMLANEEVISCVADCIAKRTKNSVVVDPVMVATSGHQLLDQGAHRCIVEKLFPLATIITPNVPEACALLGIESISSVEEMQHAARKLSELGPQSVLLKGGHLTPNDKGEIVDVFYESKSSTMRLFWWKKLSTRNTHGTGCTLASAIAASLAKGQTTLEAVEEALAYLHDVLKRSESLRLGHGPAGPMLHVAY